MRRIGDDDSEISLLDHCHIILRISQRHDKCRFSGFAVAFDDFHHTLRLVAAK